ncbi:MAG: Smr/MutS family protein, partial [Sandaracinobacter sp.]
MTRRLAPDEQALWALVAATVKPLHPGQQAEVTANMPAQAPPLPLRGVDRAGVGPRRAAPSPVTTRPVTGPSAETLDASWDRQISSGRITPDLVIDLHGLRREAARRLLYERVVAASDQGHRVILVITGKGSDPGPAPADLMQGLPAHLSVRGAIRADLPRWLGEEGLSTRIAAVRRAHPRHGGGGAA